MSRTHRAFMLGLSVVAFAQCGGDDSTGPSLTSCAGGQGAVIAFCRQVDNYEAGYGVPGQDYIIVTCIVGPSGATVSNATNGTYSCGGSYKLTTYATATISLNWGGSTNYSEYDEATVTRGEGTFAIQVTKESGGQGNLFLSMVSGSNWMFDTVPVNTLCSDAAPASEALPVADAPALPTRATRAVRVVRTIERQYGAGGRRVRLPNITA